MQQQLDFSSIYCAIKLQMLSHLSSTGAQRAQKFSGVGLLKQKGASAQMWGFIHARFIFATLCVLRKDFHAQLTEIVSIQTQSGSSWSFSLTEQRDLDANPLDSFEKNPFVWDD